MSKPDAIGTTEVAAPAERVYELIADVTESPRWTAECVANRWLDGADSAVVGARFKGVNRRGIAKWSTVSTVTDAEVGSRFAFDVSFGSVPIGRWQYDIAPDAAGCAVTEQMWDRRPGWMKVVGLLSTGVWDRATHNERNIAASLRQLKGLAEGSAA